MSFGIPTHSAQSVHETVTRLLQQSSPEQILDRFASAPPQARHLDVLYALYQHWKKGNQVSVIAKMADRCLLSHYSDSLLLVGGGSPSILRILWNEHVDFRSNWGGVPEEVKEFWEPKVEVLPPVEELTISTEESKDAVD